MIIDGHTRARTLLWQHRWLVVSCITIAAGVEWLNDHVDLNRPVFSFAAVGLLGTALSISLVFRVNEAYSRWWEARTLWGAIVNDSRSWARQVVALIIAVPDLERSEIHRRLVHRQIAYVNALRMRLRRQDALEELEPVLSDEDRASLVGKPNLPTAILQMQLEEVAALHRNDVIEEAALLRLDTTLSALTDAQGGCERIKATVFPDRVAHFTRSSAWLIASLIPILVLKPSNDLDLIDYVITPVMMLAYLLTERIGSELKTPFENLPNDTPMTTLCRTIEIDLRTTLGETDLPKPIEPVDGVLM